LFLTTTAVLALALSFTPTPVLAQEGASSAGPSVPRTADGKPNLDGIWQARNTAAFDLQDHVARLGVPAGQGVVVGNEIPYQPTAAAKRNENFQNRRAADPFGQCYMPGVPRIMYLNFPFQIFQTPQAIAMAFEWSHVHRMIYTDGSAHPEDLEFWMGDSRGRWEGDTLVVDVTNHNDKTWLDAAGNFHTDALHVVERYRLLDRDTIQYEATIEDADVFTRPWTIRMPLHRRSETTRLLEYECQAEVEEENGAFPREERTWYAGRGSSAPAAEMESSPPAAPVVAAVAQGIRRMPDGKPDLQGIYQSDGGGGNQGLERHARDQLTPAGRGLIVDPPDGKLPSQPWARAEEASRFAPERGYDDPTAHCFAAGVPRSMYVPQLYQIVQTADYVVFLFERMSWRIVPLDRRPHLPDHMRLWQGDSIGRWDGDTLVVETTNLNGKTWLNEVGQVVSHAERVVERFTPAEANSINYQATVTDPIVYTRPWTLAFPIKRQKSELLEVACHEDDQDLAHLKAIKEAAAKK
jgi:hypothetical protein